MKVTSFISGIDILFLKGVQMLFGLVIIQLAFHYMDTKDFAGFNFIISLITISMAIYFPITNLIWLNNSSSERDISSGFIFSSFATLAIFFISYFILDLTACVLISGFLYVQFRFIERIGAVRLMVSGEVIRVYKIMTILVAGELIIFFIMERSTNLGFEFTRFLLPGCWVILASIYLYKDKIKLVIKGVSVSGVNNYLLNKTNYGALLYMISMTLLIVLDRLVISTGNMFLGNSITLLALGYASAVFTLASSLLDGYRSWIVTIQNNYGGEWEEYSRKSNYLMLISAALFIIYGVLFSSYTYLLLDENKILEVIFWASSIFLVFCIVILVIPLLILEKGLMAAKILTSIVMLKIIMISIGVHVSELLYMFLNITIFVSTLFYVRKITNLFFKSGPV